MEHYEVFFKCHPWSGGPYPVFLSASKAWRTLLRFFTRGPIQGARAAWHRKRPRTETDGDAKGVNLHVHSESWCDRVLKISNKVFATRSECPKGDMGLFLLTHVPSRRPLQHFLLFLSNKRLQCPLAQALRQAFVQEAWRARCSLLIRQINKIAVFLTFDNEILVLGNQIWISGLFLNKFIHALLYVFLFGTKYSNVSPFLWWFCGVQKALQLTL